MPSRPPRAQAAAAGSALALLLGAAAAAQTVEIVRSPYPAQLMARADGAIRMGDFSGARRLYEMAAGQGVAAAATGLGKTYDPLQLARMGGTIAADAGQAELWYRRGADLGDPEAPPLLRSLKSREEDPQPAMPETASLDRTLRLLGVEHPTDEDRRRAADLQNIPHLKRSPSR